jgi:AraC-like DNA-binding protein/quercetin dioxygenase-like cupin family protein
MRTIATSVPRELLGKSKLFVARTQDASPEMRAQLHYHSFYEIAWLELGQATFICDFNRYTLQAGSIVFISPGQVHKWESDHDYNVIVVGFKPTLLSQNWMNAGLLSALPYFDISAEPCLPIASPHQPIFNAMFTQLFNLYRELGQLERHYIELAAEYEHLLTAYLHVILVESERQYPPLSPESHSEGRTAKQLTQSFLTLVESHYTERWQIQEYAYELGVSVDHLIDTVRSITGKTPKQLAQDRLRLEAERLLAYSDQTIAQISQQLSFQNPTQFGQWFKKIAVTTPSHFRDRFNIP